VLLTRQFRMQAYVNGCVDGLLIEACAGLLDGQDPAACIRREAEEEAGVRVRARRSCSCSMRIASGWRILGRFRGERRYTAS